MLALPRGGVPVAFEVARELRAPLDVFLVRKLGVPGHEELAMGAIASGGVLVLNERVLRMLEISDEVVNVGSAEKGRQELQRRESLYRETSRRWMRGGASWCWSMMDSRRALPCGRRWRRCGSRIRRGLSWRCRSRPPETCRDLESEVEQVICLESPDPFYAVGLYLSPFSAGHRR